MGNAASSSINGRRRRSNSRRSHPPPETTTNRYMFAAVTPYPSRFPHAPSFYHYYPPPPPPMPVPKPVAYVEHQKAVTIRNDVNLKKDTLRLVPDEENLGNYLVTFTFDATVSGRKLQQRERDQTFDHMAKPPSIPNIQQETRHKRVTVRNSHGEELVGMLHETNSVELVIICHGFKSSKDRIPMVNLAAAFEKDGISAFRFDFAGNGESEGSFQYGNYRREADDLRAVVEHFHEEKRFIAAIVGHSKGGNAVLLYASRYKDVQTVINISGRFNLERGIEGRLGRDFRQKIKQDGFIDVRNRRGGFEYRVTEESLMDRLTTDTRGACQSIPTNCRVLTIHGTIDEMVPVEDATEFSKNVPNHKLHIIEGADHEFTLHQYELALVVVAFVKEGLRGDYMAMPSQTGKRISGYIRSRF